MMVATYYLMTVLKGLLKFLFIAHLSSSATDLKLWYISPANASAIDSVTMTTGRLGLDPALNDVCIKF